MRYNPHDVKLSLAISDVLPGRKMMVAGGDNA